jgi:hypothetical protein
MGGNGGAEVDLRRKLVAIEFLLTGVKQPPGKKLDLAPQIIRSVAGPLVECSISKAPAPDMES